MRTFNLWALGLALFMAAYGSGLAKSPGYTDDGLRVAESDADMVAGAAADIGINAVETEWSKAYWPNGADQEEEALAVASGWSAGLPPAGAFSYFSYTLAKQGRNAMVLKLNDAGTPISSFGTAGWRQITLPSSWISLNNATFGANSALLGRDYKRAYFVGSVLRGTAPNRHTDMGVLCFDFTVSDGRCAGWPSSSVSYVGFDHGGSNYDWGDVIAFDPDGYIYVAGVVTNAQGTAVGVARLHAASGALDTSFNGTGKRSYVFNYASNGGAYAPKVTSVAFAPAGSPGGKFLYVGGSFQSSNGSRDGFVLQVAPASAAYRMKQILYENDNPFYMSDEVTALTVLADGKVAFAGWSETDSSNFPALLLGRIQPDFFYDSTFCGYGVCAYAQNGSLLVSQVRNIRPSAIGERQPSGDLVIALNGEQRVNAPLGPYTARQRLQVWNPSGTSYRFGTDLSYFATPGHFENAWAAGMEVDGSAVLLSGWRRYGDTDTDVTVSSLLITDPPPSVSIFKDGFEGM